MEFLRFTDATERNAHTVTRAMLDAGPVECILLNNGNRQRAVGFGSGASIWEDILIADVSGNSTLLAAALSHVQTNMPLAGATYSPTFATGNNTESAGTLVGRYCRVGSIVMVSVYVPTVEHTAAAASTFGVSLPVTSDLAATSLHGGCLVDDNSSGSVIADASNDRILASYTSPTDSTHDMIVWANYEVI